MKRENVLVPVFANGPGADILNILLQTVAKMDKMDD